jgi:hypothetical protein
MVEENSDWNFAKHISDVFSDAALTDKDAKHA